jgi:hypothetical protein
MLPIERASPVMERKMLFGKQGAEKVPSDSGSA